MREIAGEGGRSEGDAFPTNAVVPNDEEERAARAGVCRMCREELAERAIGDVRAVAV